MAPRPRRWPCGYRRHGFHAGFA